MSIPPFKPMNEITGHRTEEEILDDCVEEVGRITRGLIPGRTVIIHRPDYGDRERHAGEPMFNLTIRPWPDVPDREAHHQPRRDDEVAAWFKRMRDFLPPDSEQYQAVDRLLDRYRECSDYGLTLLPEDDERGDP